MRLYISRSATDTAGKVFDLYGAFEAAVQDEEDFRAELRRYAEINAEEGRPQIRPEDIPPMVFQTLPWLKPTAGNKMYNAELSKQGDGGGLKDFVKQPDRSPAVNRGHFKLVQPLLSKVQAEDSFPEDSPFPSLRMKIGRTFEARYGILTNQEMLTFLKGFKWTPNYTFRPTIRFIEDEIGTGTIEDWFVMLPLLDTVRRLKVEGIELPIQKRVRRVGRPGFSGSSFRQRSALEAIAGGRNGESKVLEGTKGAVPHYTPTRGALLLTFALDQVDREADPKQLAMDAQLDSADVVTLFSLAVPYASAPGGRIGFTTIKGGSGAIVDRDQSG